MITKFSRLMMENNVPQHMLADYLGTYQPKISNWASGSAPIPAKYVIPLCELFKVRVDELLGWEEDEPSYG